MAINKAVMTKNDLIRIVNQVIRRGGICATAMICFMGWANSGLSSLGWRKGKSEIPAHPRRMIVIIGSFHVCTMQMNGD